MKAAKVMSWQSRRLVRNILIAERARVLQERNLQPKRAGWIARRRDANAQRAATREKLSGLLPTCQSTVVVRAPTSTTQPDAGSRGQVASTETRPAPAPAAREAASLVAAAGAGGDRPWRSLIEDVLADAKSVAPPPQARSVDQGQLLRRQPERLLDVAALAQPAVGRELSLIERMAAGSALDSVRAMPLQGRPQAPDQDHSDRSEESARTTAPDGRFDRSR